MNRFITLAILIALSSLAGKAQQRDWSSIDIGVSELNTGIYRLFVNNSVAVVISTGQDGLLVIDAGYEQSTGRLMEEIRKITPEPISYLINTHLHGDHTGGNKVLGLDATIIAHPFVKKYLSTEQRRGENVIPPFPDYALPTVLVEDELDLDFNGETLEIKHLPGGHTQSDLVVFFPRSNVLVMGDLLFAGYFPYIDTGNGGNPQKFLDNVEWIINNYPEDVIIVGGHGPVYNMEQLKQWNATLNQTIAHLKKAKEEGMSAEEMKQNQVLENWAEMGSFFITEERWIDTIYPFLL